MDHDKLINEAANIFGRSLEAPSTETPDIQEGIVRNVLGGARRRLRRVAGNIAAKVTASTDAADASDAKKGETLATVKRWKDMTKDKRFDPEYTDVRKPAYFARADAQKEGPAALAAHDAAVEKTEAEAKEAREKGRWYRQHRPGTSELKRRKKLAKAMGKQAKLQAANPDIWKPPEGTPTPKRVSVTPRKFR